MAIDVQSSRHLDEELVTLRRLLFDMSELVDEQVAGAIDAVANCDVELAQRIRERDDEVDRLELAVDHQCERILALFTPVAVDLRLIISAVKVNTDLERIGDHAKNLAKNTPRVKDCSDLVRETRIREMADEARGVLHLAQDAFMKQDRVLAREVLAHDRRVDRLHDESLQKLGELIRRNPERSDELVHLVNMAKSVERIADHAKNIAELVVFLVEGVDIRHRGAQGNSDDDGNDGA